MWKISITDKPSFVATNAGFTSGTVNLEYKSFTDNLLGIGAWKGSKTGTPPLPDLRWESVTKQVEIQAGESFSVALNLLDVTNSIVVAEKDLVNAYGQPLNIEGIAPQLSGEVAVTNTATAPATNAFWTALPASTATIYPAYSWQIPANAAIGDAFYTAVRATHASTEYVALFKITVVGAPAADPVADTAEESGLMSNIFTYSVYAGVIGAVIFFFVL